jgi:hypothetical protein
MAQQTGSGPQFPAPVTNARRVSRRVDEPFSGDWGFSTLLVVFTLISIQ